MAEPKVLSTSRPDIDIKTDVAHLLMSYPPLAHDRHQIKYTVEDGVVTLSGYVKAAPTFRYVLNRLPDIPGVKAVHTQDFYNDDALRLDIGRLVPPGVTVTMEYGAVILAGTLPEGTTVEDLVKEVALVSGVHRVLTSFTA